MKKVILGMAVIAALASCSKNNEGPSFKLSKSDTLTTGNLWNMNVTDAAADVYTSFQSNLESKKPGPIFLAQNIFTTLESVKDNYGLYKAIDLGETNASASDIRLIFNGDSVQTIATNNYTIALAKWPAEAEDAKAIKPGTKINDLYAKFVEIKAMTNYASKFQKIGLYHKDGNKSYDTNMEKSAQWIFNANMRENISYEEVKLDFTDKKLTKIIHNTYELK